MLDRLVNLACEKITDPDLGIILKDYLRQLPKSPDCDDNSDILLIAQQLAYECSHLLLVIRIYIAEEESKNIN